MTEPVTRETLLRQRLDNHATGAVELRRITLQPDVAGGPHHHNGPVFGVIEFLNHTGEEPVLTAGPPPV